MTHELDRVGRPATHEDVPAIAACLTSAFFDDPLWGRWTFPDEVERRQKLPEMMQLMAELSLGGIWTDVAPGGEAITVWTPPGRVYGGAPGEAERAAELFRRLFGPRAAELDALWAQFEEHLPDGRFYHLEWWATRVEHQGQGYGGALLRENLARVDAEHLPAYLESTNPANLARYEAYGFRAVGEFAPAHGPTITTMWRDAR